MFDRIKKALTSPIPGLQPDHAGPGASSLDGPVSEWAATQGMAFTQGAGSAFALKGRIAGKPWRMEVGPPSRDYIRGEELRGRAELGVNEDAAVMVMSRSLKESLEKKAFALYTDSLQTVADPNLPEEMRWLSVYPEVGWSSLPREFWNRYAVLADRRENALAWIDASLARQLMDWPAPGPAASVPFTLLLLRGKAYLRMQYEPADMPTLQHATAIFTSACDAAIGGLSNPAKP